MMLSRSLRYAALALFAVALSDCGGTEPSTPSDPATETYAASLGVDISQMTRLNDQLYIQDLVVGTGASAARGSTVVMNYTGWLANGTQFDSNQSGTLPPILLGQGQVIAGWDEGIPGMRVGGKRRLVIGSTLGYGSSSTDNGKIPGNSTLIFDVQLLSSK